MIAHKPALSQWITDGIFLDADKNKDGVISEEEWLSEAEKSDNIKMLIDPNQAAPLISNLLAHMQQQQQQFQQPQQTYYPNP
jgi:hypothetical protein